MKVIYLMTGWLPNWKNTFLYHYEFAPARIIKGNMLKEENFGRGHVCKFEVEIWE